MEKNQTQFLTDILAQIQALKEQIEQLETQVVEYIGKETISEKTELAEAEDLPEAETPQDAAEPELIKEPTLLDEDDDLPEDDIPPAKPHESTIEEAAEETIEKAVGKEITIEETKGQETVDLKIDDDFEVLPLGEAIASAKDAVMDKMAEKESWRTDMPGSSVNDIRSAISLNDRILFINTLFHEDPIAFKDTLSELNAMPSFEEGVRYLKGRHPEWNTESEVVYRFMMAVRRKLK